MKKNIKKKRVLFLDIAKGLAILFMFMQHCMIIHEINAWEWDNILANIFLLLWTAPAAPVFMLIMWIFIAQSKASFQKNIFRWIKLILLWYLLNLLRFTVPMMIASWENNTIYFEWEGPLDMLLAIDILQLAGLSIIFWTFIKKLIDSRIFIPILVLWVLLSSPYIWGSLDQYYISHLFWWDKINIYFPFFPWVIYPLIGMYIGKKLLDNEILDKYLKSISIFGIALLAIGFLTLDMFPVWDYHRSWAAIHFLMIGFIFLWLKFCYFISKKSSDDNKIVNTISFWSKNVTAIYFIQWTIFGWSMLIFDANKQNAYVSALIGLVVLIITHFTVKSEKVKKLFSLI